ncbi:hypothetical protein SNEBB_005130 [Seison nebaliae]|nr:hypothetical protein SNEBB_005130 [Seison nebaliae]
MTDYNAISRRSSISAVNVLLCIIVVFIITTIIFVWYTINTFLFLTLPFGNINDVHGIVQSSISFKNQILSTTISPKEDEGNDLIQIDYFRFSFSELNKTNNDDQFFPSIHNEKINTNKLHSRYRRSTNHINIINLHVFNETLKLRIWKDREPFARYRLPIEHLYENGTVHHQSITGIDNCFYVGNVNHDPNSHVFLSTCNNYGDVNFGSFSYENYDYFIEPDKQTRNKRSIQINQNDDINKLGGRLIVKRIYRGLSNFSNDVVADLKRVKENKEININRNKRASSDVIMKENYVEVLLVADAKMNRFHGDDLSNYVLTVMGMVSNIYRDASIGNSINIFVSKLLIIHDEAAGPAISSKAFDTLRSFCKWQSKKNVDDDKLSGHHDTAILITRENICRSEENCNTLGMAEVGTLCDAKRSCSIAEDNGLGVAFTIAHELGHVFNLPHDDDKKCDEDNIDDIDHHVMAPVMKGFPWTWSACSRRIVTQFLKNNHHLCLSDIPIDLEFQNRVNQLIKRYPGQIYNLHRQCEKVLGIGSRVCHMETCGRLYCKEAHNNKCRVTVSKWVDGTKCGANSWCMRGKCVPLYSQPSPIQHGNWGNWSEWSQCTRSCGGGVRYAVRFCNNPSPRNGGRSCQGKFKMYDTCNRHECQSPIYNSFREEQCAQHNGNGTKRFDGLPPDVRWVPDYDVDADLKCKLVCRVQGLSSVKVFGQVIDGTKCNEKTTNICIDGECIHAGCDNQLNSTKKFDLCGVCEGNNSTCKIITNNLHTATKQKTRVVRIPKGSHSIYISQIGANIDKVFLVLRTEFHALVNDEKIITTGKTTVYDNLLIRYSGHDDVKETIEIIGITKEPLYLFVLLQDEPPQLVNVTYYFVIPATSTSNHQSWSGSSDSDHVTSITNHRRNHQFNNYYDNQPNNHMVIQQNEKSEAILLSNHNDQTNSNSDTAAWSMDALTECSSPCNGYVELKPKCVRAKSSHEIAESACQMKVKPPNSRQRCNTHCRFMYVSTPHSKCRLNNPLSKCGEGYIYRELSCTKVDIKSNKITAQVHDDYCAGVNRERLSRTHCTIPCPKQSSHNDLKASPTQQPSQYIWRYGAWSSCSVKCRKIGYRQRLAKCSYRGKHSVPDEFCDSAQRFVRKKCYLTDQPCSLRWENGDWSKCNGTFCQKGYQERTVYCVDDLGNRVEKEKCRNLLEHMKPFFTLTQEEPLQRKICRQSCGNWKSGRWEKCKFDKKCVRSMQISRRYRKVFCTIGFQKLMSHSSENDFIQLPSKYEIVHKSLPDSHCDPNTRPISVKYCEKVSCAIRIIGKWQNCDSKCGKGKEIRTIRCVDKKTYVDVDEDRCNYLKDDITERECHSPCYSWQYEPWSSCSKSCGNGIKSRQSMCVRQMGNISTLPDPNDHEMILHVTGTSNSVPVPTIYCRSMEKPIKQIKTCKNQDCFEWKINEWSTCSKKCGIGTQFREVNCIAGNEIFADEYCVQLTERKPTLVQDCIRYHCAKWTSGEWSPCSRTCGIGRSERNVHCMVRSKIVNDNECVSDERPSRSRMCRIGACYKWKRHKWSKCSVGCGRGRSFLLYRCVNELGKIVEKEKCVKNKLPRKSKLCVNYSSCSWNIGQWSPCSVTCGLGIQKRRIDCIDANRIRRKLQKRYCERTSPSPTTTKNCYGKYTCGNWETTEWQTCPVEVECQKNISLSYQTRNISCEAKDFLSNKSLKVVCDVEDKPMTKRLCDPQPKCGKVFVRRNKENFEWKTYDWSLCTTTCGKGFRTRRVICMNDKKLKANETLCNKNIKPFTHKYCDLPKCYIWDVGPYNECICEKGEAKQRRKISCIEKDENKMVDKKFCDSSKTPFDKRHCPYKKSCNTKWSVGDWNKCRDVCEVRRPFQKRNISCPENYVCSIQDRPVSTKRCDNSICFTWRTSEWSECKNTKCNEQKERYRTVKCIHTTFINVTSTSKCKRIGKPKTITYCSSVTLCQTISPKPMTVQPVRIEKNNIQFTPLLPKMTTTTSRLLISNLSSNHRNFRYSNLNKKYPIRTTIPSSSHQLRRRLLSNNKYFATWTDWSKNDDSATLQSKVNVTPLLLLRRKQTSQSYPTQTTMTRPYDDNDDVENCGPICGIGEQARGRMCVDRQEKRYVSLKYCGSNNEMEHSEKKPCVAYVECKSWLKFPWKQCIYDCDKDDYIQQRNVSCVTNGTRDEVLPFLLALRDETEYSLRPSWEKLGFVNDSTSDHTSYDASFDINDNDRTFHRYIKLLPDFHCDLSMQPIKKRICYDKRQAVKDRHKCHLHQYKIEFGDWSQCNRNCGFGSRYRQLKCIRRTSRGEEQVSNKYCRKKLLRYPTIHSLTVEQCKQRNCEYFWHTGEFSKCACRPPLNSRWKFEVAIGYQYRNITCRQMIDDDTREIIVNDNLCNSQLRPKSIIECTLRYPISNYRHCAFVSPSLFENNNMKRQHLKTNIWRTGSWSKCSANCGLGVQYRLISCYTLNIWIEKRSTGNDHIYYHVGTTRRARIIDDIFCRPNNVLKTRQLIRKQPCFLQPCKQNTKSLVQLI